MRKKAETKRTEYRFDKYTLKCLDYIMHEGFGDRKAAVVYCIQSTYDRLKREKEQEEKNKKE